MSRCHMLAAVAAALALAACGDRPAPTAVHEPAPSPLATRAAIRALPRVVGAPRPVPATEVEGELAAARHDAHAAPHDFQAYVAGFDQARTVRGLNQLAFAARATLGLRHEHTRPESAALQQIGLAYNRAAGGVAPSPMLGFSSGQPCMVSFDQPVLLAPHAAADDPQALYASPIWAQRCGVGTIEVEPLFHGHFHLNFEDTTIDCWDADAGGFGRGEPDDCTALAQPANEPRYIATHLGSEVIRIRRRAGGANLPFTLHTVAVVGDTPVKVRYRVGNGPWFQWNSLAGNTIWDFSAHVIGATEVQITNAETSLSCGLDWVAAGPGGCPVGAGVVFLDDIAISP